MIMIPKQPSPEWFKKYEPALKAAGTRFGEQFAERAKAAMDAIGDPEAEAAAQREWERFAIERRDEIMDVLTRTIIREAVIRPIARALAEEMKMPELKADKEPTAADLFPSLRSQTN